MKRFFKHTILFIIPILAGWVLLMFKPLDKKRAFHYLTDDCEGRGAWMYKRIYESDEPIDIAFLGSSHTINGINDTLINQNLQKEGVSSRVCNMGYCRFGRDLTYTLMKILIEEKNTKTFIIEVQKEESPFSHPVFPFITSGENLLNPQIIFNRSYIPNIYKGSVAKLMYLRQNLFKEPYQYKYELKSDYGFTTNIFEADTNTLYSIKKRRENKVEKASDLEKRINLAYPSKWLRKIDNLAKKKGCTIFFLYMPPYGTPQKIPLNQNMYSCYGDTWILPDSILFNKKNWYDTDHMNLRGANETSEIMTEKILEILN